MNFTDIDSIADTDTITQSESHQISPESCAQRARSDLRNAALVDAEQRNLHLTLHPLNQRPITVLTRSIREAFVDICESIKFKRPGYCLMADFRVGKSTSLSMILQKLPEVLPNTAFCLISAQSHTQVTERNFWGDVVMAMGLAVRGTAQERKNLVRSAVIAACTEVSGRHFVLLIDEGQSWTQREFTWLRDLANQLREQDGYLMTTVIMGDLRLPELSVEFQSNRKDLWARFLTKPKPFFGIRNLEDLKFFLNELDSSQRCEYPAGSGISYTEFFLPKAFDQGWRLRNEAAALWDAFERAAKNVNREAENIGMQWVGEAVTRYLTSHMHVDCAHFSPEANAWDLAVEQACFVDSLI